MAPPARAGRTGDSGDMMSKRRTAAAPAAGLLDIGPSVRVLDSAAAVGTRARHGQVVGLIDHGGTRRRPVALRRSRFASATRMRVGTSRTGGWRKPARRARRAPSQPLVSRRSRSRSRSTRSSSARSRLFLDWCLIRSPETSGRSTRDRYARTLDSVQVKSCRDRNQISQSKRVPANAYRQLQGAC